VTVVRLRFTLHTLYQQKLGYDLYSLIRAPYTFILQHSKLISKTAVSIVSSRESKMHVPSEKCIKHVIQWKGNAVTASSFIDVCGYNSTIRPQ
jgi:hypothetical protein